MASIGTFPRYAPPAMPAGTGTRRDTELDRVRTLARVLDRYYVDPLLGLLLPGGGDVIGSMLGIYTVMVAVRRKVSPVIIARMLMNLLLDTVLGIIPLVGDLFDFGFKAHLKNVDLLSERAEHGGRASARDWAFVIGVAFAYMFAMALIIWGVIALFRRVF